MTSQKSSSGPRRERRVSGGGSERPSDSGRCNGRRYHHAFVKLEVFEKAPGRRKADFAWASCSVGLLP
jgi:hypothetical protein